MNILAIIQARMDSTRLPNKVLLDLAGKTVLEHVVERVKRSKMIDDIVVATTISPNDLDIVKLCSNKEIRVFCGSEDDVLDRYYQLAKLIKPEHIVRITADCPMIDPEIIDQVIQLHVDNKSDYTSNTLKETYPDGEDIEVFRFKALRTAWENANLLSEREHVTPYIINNPDLFKLENLENKIDLSQKRWTLDEPKDFEFIKKVFSNVYVDNNNFTMNSVLKFLEENPNIESINQHIARNEGYAKSLTEDKKID